LALFYFSGQRIGDVYQFGLRHVVGDELIFTQTKNAGVNPMTLTLPILPDLKVALDAVPQGQKTFLVNDYGKSLTLKGFGNKMRQWCDEAGLNHCSAHGIRKSGATTMARTPQRISK
jgi:integrase